MNTRGKDGRTLSVALGLKGCTSGEMVRAPRTGAAPNRNYAIVMHITIMTHLVVMMLLSIRTHKYRNASDNNICLLKTCILIN